MRVILSLIFLSLMISLINSEAQPATLVIEGTLFDHYPDYSPNFETDIGSSEISAGIVQRDLNLVTRTPNLVSMDPLYNPNKLGSMNHPEMFKWHFQSNQNAPLTAASGANIPMAFNITLNLNPDTGTYVFNNQYFYPIDTKGYDVVESRRKYKQSGVYHNFHFCLKINSRFTFNGGEVFNFIGDDDVWVFINDKLVVDIGGIHPPKTGNVALNNLGLKVGESYTFDLFYCERHTDGSTIKIETSIQAKCPWFDYCGVCTGDGTTCCNPKTNCNDENPCTIDKCPPPSTVIPNLSQLSEFCSNTPVVCPVIDKCTNNQCGTDGTCKSSKIVCQDRSGECLKLDKCDPSSGCIYSSTCLGSKCLTGECSRGTCVQKTNSTCSEELTYDICKEYSCDLDNGCVSKPKCPQLDNICITNFCHPQNGTCGETLIPQEDCNCDCTAELAANKCLLPFCDVSTGKCAPKDKQVDDGNECTLDMCDKETGIVTNVAKTTCGGCSECNVKTGLCEANSNNCQDGNACTDNVCLLKDNIGTCSNSTKNCQGTDKCLVYSCDSATDCTSTALVCPDAGNCQVGYCDLVQGCLLKPRECVSTAFCITTLCDESIGCISFDKVCPSSNTKCQRGVCRNATEEDEGKCDEEDYDPLPFICKTAAVISTAVVAGVVVASVIGAAAIAFGSKKGYDYWKQTHGNNMSASNSNPLYEQSKNNNENPLYAGNDA